MSLALTISQYKQHTSSKGLQIAKKYQFRPYKRLQVNKSIFKFRGFRQFQRPFLSKANSCIITHIKKIDSGSVYQIKSNINNNDGSDKLYTLYVRSKSTKVIKKNKSMTITTNKLKEIHANLGGTDDLLS